MIVELLEKNHVLQNLHLEITPYCNLACKHCYVSDRSSGKQNGEVMSLDLVKWLIQEAKDLGALTVTLTGGEPLTHPNFCEILHIAAECNIAVKVMTNGTLITSQNIDLIKKRVNHLYLTQYGCNKHDYERTVAKRGSYEKFEKAVKLLKKEGISFDVNYTMVASNCNHAGQIAQKFKTVETHISYQKDNPYSKKYQAPLNRLYEYYSSIEDRGPILYRKRRVCNICASSLVIKADGVAVPCPSFVYPLGNVHECSLETIWKSKKTQELRAMSNFENFYMCRNCEYREYSYNLCLANNFNETGEMFCCSETTCRTCKVLYDICEGANGKAIRNKT